MGGNKEGPWPTCSAWPIKAKPLCPFFSSGTGSRVSPSSRPQTNLSSSRPFLSVPTFVPVSLFLANSRHTISLPAHRKDYHTRNTCPRVYAPRFSPSSFHQRLSYQRFLFLDALSIPPSPFPPPLLSFLFASKHANAFSVRFGSRNREYILPSPENHPRSSKEEGVLFLRIYRDRIVSIGSSFSPFSSNGKKERRVEASVPRRLGLRNRDSRAEVVKREFSSN